MKKYLIISLLLIACFASITPVPALEYGEAFYIKNKRSFLSGNLNDPARMLRRELDGYGADGGDVWYVDGNRSDDLGDGKTWATAKQLLASALALSHADIAVSADRQWASRNRIYVKGDEITETLTKLAQKTDVIGVGSTSQHPRPRIIGTHTIEAQTEDDYMGCRFFNVEFYGSSAAAIMTIPADQNGAEFHYCYFTAAASATIGLNVTSTHDLVVNNCRFDPDTNSDFSVAAIQIDSGTITNLTISNNVMWGQIGIDADCSTANTGVNCRISGNTINATGMTIDCESDDVIVANNTLISSTYGAAAFDFNVALASNNKLTTPVRTVNIPYTHNCAGAVAAAQRGAFGNIYYVDGNAAASGGDGLTWETSCQVLATALAKSHANIAVSAQRGWAWRNTIYVRGDEITEDLTKLAQKTDVVGVGSANQSKRATLIGKHVIESATNHYMGCRIYNLRMYDDDAGGILFDIPINQNGIEFHNCVFQVGSTDSIGLRLGGNHDTIVDGCTFQPDLSGNDFSIAAIQVLNGAGGLTMVRISNNHIGGCAIGIDWDETANLECYIENNTFQTSGMCVDSEDVTKLYVIDNRMHTLVEPADNTSNDFNIAYAINNMVTGASTTLYIPTYSDD